MASTLLNLIENKKKLKNLAMKQRAIQEKMKNNEKKLQRQAAIQLGEAVRETAESMQMDPSEPFVIGCILYVGHLLKSGDPASGDRLRSQLKGLYDQYLKDLGSSSQPEGATEDAPAPEAGPEEG